jgi:ADP-ribose pyrophosphatase
MKRIALYGGSFDPPHLGHVITITAVFNSKLADEIWLVPTGLARDKELRASAEERKTMIGIMLSTMFGSKVPVYLNATQIDRSWVVSTTSDLMQEMESLYPDCTFNFVIGSDLVSGIPHWHAAEKIMSRPGLFLMMQRLGHEMRDPLPPYVVPLPTGDLALTNISSSLVRRMIAEGHSLEGIVPPAVINHILRSRLYRNAPAEKDFPHLLEEGRFLKLMRRNGWEYAERKNCTGVVVIVALTDSGKLLLTEQFRVPVSKPVIEFPAGLVGDTGQAEAVDQAAMRELFEETGYRAKSIEHLAAGPVSSGMTSEIISFVRAKGLKKEGPGGGDESESITVHEIPLADVPRWLAECEHRGLLVDPKVYTGLHFLR